MRRVLVTGGTGFIGHHLVRRLLPEVERVDIADDFSRGKRDAEIDALGPKVRIHECDLRGTNALDDLPDDYDTVFHLAALLGVANVRARPAAVLSDNAAMNMVALAFAGRQKNLSRFVFASTSEVYAGTQAAIGVPVPTPEDVALLLPPAHEPRSTYALSKIYGESLAIQSGLPFTIVRPHNVYGPRMGMAHVVPELMARAFGARDGDSLEVFSPDHTRTFCYVEDAVELLCRAGERAQAKGEIINVGSQTPEIRIRELAERVVTTVGRRLTLVGKPPMPGSPPRRCPDTRKAKRLLGYQAQVGLDEGLERTFAWYRDHIFKP